MLKPILLLYTAVIMISFILTIIGVPIFGVIIVISLVLLVYLYHYVYIPYFSNDIVKVDKFLFKNKKMITYQFYYGVTNHLDHEVEESYRRIMIKPGFSSRKVLFKIVYAFYIKDFEIAKAEVAQITHPEVKLYYQALLALEDHDLETCRTILAKLKKTWSKETINANIELKEGNLIEAKIHAERAIACTRGLQKYSVIKHFEQEFAEKKSI